MKNPVKEVYNAIIPDYRDLWHRGGADVRNVEIEPGRHADVPFFDDLEIVKMKEGEKGLILDHRGKPIGDYLTHHTKLSDGLYKRSRLYLPSDAHGASHDAMMNAVGAWTTTIEGHNHEMASRFVEEVKLPILVIESQSGTSGESGIAEIMKVPGTFNKSTKTSLAKIAFSAQLINEAIRSGKGLSRNIVVTGESCGYMVSPAEAFYATLFDNEAVYMDGTAACVPKKLFSERKDFIRLAAWPGTEVLGAIAVGVEVARQRGLKRQIGTVSSNPNHVVNNIVGVGPALFSGEAGEFISWTRHDLGIYMSMFANDFVSRPDIYKQLLSNHENARVRVYKRGTHMTLAHQAVIKSKSARINPVLEIRSKFGRNPTHEEYEAIFDIGRRQRPDVMRPAA